MATIEFSNINIGVLNGLTFNPGFEDVLDPAAAPVFAEGGMNPDTFTYTNNSGGPFQGFKIELKGTGFNAGGTMGDITDVTIYAPDGSTVIAKITGINTSTDSLSQFHTLLINPDEGVLSAFDYLLNDSDTINGSAIADHVTNFGYYNNVTMLAGGGDDVLWVRSKDTSYANGTIAGQAGNDVIRVEYGSFEIHGAETNGDGGDGETDTLELVTEVNGFSEVQLNAVTDIDALRFAVYDIGAPVLEDTELELELDASMIGAGLLSPTLAVQGTTAPLSEIEIRIETDTSPSNTTPVVLDLSQWTFTDWNDDRNEIEINANDNAVVNDNIVGSAVHDYINTYAGDDTLQGGAGGDQLYGGLGNDTFVYGANEAGENEYVSGGDEDNTTLDKVVLLGSNDFGDTNLNDIDQIVFQGAGTSSFSQWSIDMWEEQVVTIIGDGNANGLAFVLQKDAGYSTAIDLSDLQFQSWTGGSDLVSIRGTNAKDIITGSTQNDVIAGGKGSDDLQGNEGGDAFLFDFTLGKGVDHVADFERKEGDIIQLAASIFDELDPGKLKKKAFTTGTEADDKNDRIIYDKDDGVLRYDDDGSGKHDAQIIAVLDNAAQLKAGDLFVV